MCNRLKYLYNARFVFHFNKTNNKQVLDYNSRKESIYTYIQWDVIKYMPKFTSPPEGVARYCFHPICLSVCLSVCVSVCLCVCVSVCLCVCCHGNQSPNDERQGFFNIFVFYFSAIGRDIDLKFIQDTYRVVIN